jgi:hypothetical protein
MSCSRPGLVNTGHRVRSKVSDVSGRDGCPNTTARPRAAPHHRRRTGRAGPTGDIEKVPFGVIDFSQIGVTTGEIAERIRDRRAGRSSAAPFGRSAVGTPGRSCDYAAFVHGAAKRAGSMPSLRKRSTNARRMYSELVVRSRRAASLTAVARLFGAST